MRENKLELVKADREKLNTISILTDEAGNYSLWYFRDLIKGVLNGASLAEIRDSIRNRDNKYLTGFPFDR